MKRIYSVFLLISSICSLRLEAKEIAHVDLAFPLALSATISSTDITCNGACNGTATVVASGGITPYTYSWSPSGGSAAQAVGLCAATYTCTITDNVGESITKTITITQPTQLVVTMQEGSSFRCHNSSIPLTAVVTGGTGTITYDWLPGNPSGDGTRTIIAGGGTYTVLVSDANHCAQASIVLVPPAPVTASVVSSTNIPCKGTATGVATLAASGGNAQNYYFSWPSPYGMSSDPTRSGLAAGTYTVTVSDYNFCSAPPLTVTITEPSTMLTSSVVSTVHSTCATSPNGSITVAASNGVGTLSYSWSPSGGNAATATGLDAGTYTATIQDENACTSTQTVSITAPSPIDIYSVYVERPTCYDYSDGSITAYVMGGTGSDYTYSWSPSGNISSTASGLHAGTHTVTVRDEALCAVSKSVTLTEPAELFVPLTISNARCNESDGYIAVYISTPYDYRWSTGSSNSYIANLSAGTYTLTLTDNNGCSATQEAVVEQDICTGILVRSDEKSEKIRMYPNPISTASGTLTLEPLYQDNINSITLSTCTGMPLQVAAEAHLLDLKHLKSGMYLIEVLTDKGMEIKKLLIE